MSKLFVVAVPILPGKTEEWRKFINELRTKRFSDFAASRRRLKVRERSYFQQTPIGDLVLVTLEGDDPQAAFAQFASAKDDFTRWFVQQVKAIHGFDLAQPPQGPMPEQIIDSEGSTASS